MLPKNLPWLRYWIKQDAAQRYQNNGFLQEIDPENVVYWPDYPQPLERLRDNPVLILLGEPGMGKTNSLQHEVKLLQSMISPDEDACAFFDLAEFGSDQSLTKEIFQGWLLNTKQNKHCDLYLFLDSFDECRLDIRNLVRVLLRELRAPLASLPRLKLRISCRSADWPPTLTEGLEEICGKEKVIIYELCPLCRSDIVLAAQGSGISDTEPFLEAVHNNELESLASRPKTLGYLISEFRDADRLPVSRISVYEQGINHLCEESQVRIDAGHGGTLTTAQRMLIAGRIAAFLVFSNRSGIWAGPSVEIPDDTDIHLEQLVGDEAGFHIGRYELLETLLIAGLTRNLGHHRTTFQHRTDAEFLSAWYLRKKGTPLRQILSLLRDPKGNWIPLQLRETAGWIASMNKEVFQALIEQDPETVLVGDVPPDDNLRTQLTENLFRPYLTGECWDAPPLYRLRKLCHNQLSTIIDRIMKDSSTHFAAQHLALDIIEACAISQMEDMLIALVKNISTDSFKRKRAARMLAHIGQKEWQQVLLPYAYGEEDIYDPEDEIKGVALQALWPQHLSTNKLFQCLTPSKKGNLFGSYAAFLLGYLPKTLKQEHLPLALNWLATAPEDIRHDYHFNNLNDAIMLLAWEYLNFPEVLGVFAEAVLILLKKNESLFNRRRARIENNPLDNFSKRRILDLFANNDL